MDNTGGSEQYTYVYFDVSIGGAPEGRIILRLFKNDLPITCRNFVELTTGVHGFGYKGSIFHRAVPNFLIQGGDFMNQDGTGGRSIYGAKFQDENYKYKHNRAALLAMANTGPHSNSSQFFITTLKSPHLDNKTVVFGDVADGMDVVHAIEKCGCAAGTVKPVCRIEACGLTDWPPQRTSSDSL